MKTHIQKYILLHIIETLLNVYTNKNLKYSHTTLLNFYKSNFNIFFYKINTYYQYTSYKNFQMFNHFYLKNVFHLNLREQNVNAAFILPEKLSKTILFKTKNVSYKQFNIKYLNEVVYLFVVCA